MNMSDEDKKMPVNKQTLSIMIFLIIMFIVGIIVRRDFIFSELNGVLEYYKTLLGW